jgi:ketosteroid isomerase-like protein
MYHFVVQQIIRRGFRELCGGDYRPVTALMAEDCHYHFVGQHALGGRRHSRQLIETWFQRFLRLLPGFQFIPSEVVVSGWPWRTTIAVRLKVSWKMPDGTPYENVALQFITLRWFKAVDVLTVDDSQRVAALLDTLAGRFGVAEAAAAPIEG